MNRPKPRPQLFQKIRQIKLAKLGPTGRQNPNMPDNARFFFDDDDNFIKVDGYYTEDGKMKGFKFPDEDII